MTFLSRHITTFTTIQWRVATTHRCATYVDESLQYNGALPQCNFQCRHRLLCCDHRALFFGHCTIVCGHKTTSCGKRTMFCGYRTVISLHLLVYKHNNTHNSGPNRSPNIISTRKFESRDSTDGLPPGPNTTRLVHIRKVKHNTAYSCGSRGFSETQMASQFQNWHVREDGTFGIASLMH